MYIAECEKSKIVDAEKLLLWKTAIFQSGRIHML